MLGPADICSVPRQYSGANLIFADTAELLTSEPSHLTSESLEGVYVRRDDLDRQAPGVFGIVQTMQGEVWERPDRIKDKLWLVKVAVCRRIGEQRGIPEHPGIPTALKTQLLRLNWTELNWRLAGSTPVSATMFS